MKETIIKLGIKNLKEFGYPDVTEKTILTDEIYSAFFQSMLESNLGVNDQSDKVINDILKEINEST